MTPGTALVTGATGFVGSHVAEAFAAAGWRLRCTVRATSDLRWLETVRADRLELDLSGCSTGDAAEAVAGADVVVHVAGVTRAPDEATYARVNAEATRRLASAAASRGVRRFVLLSSLAARGPDGAAGPASAYGRSKQAAEEALLQEAADRMEALSLRPGGVYGPRDVDLLPLFRLGDRGWLPIPSGGGDLQPVYAADVASACLRAVQTEAPRFGPWPVVERGRYGWDQVRDGLEAALDRRIRLLPLPPTLFLAAARASEAAARLLGRPALLDARRAEDLARHSWTADPSSTERMLDWRAAVALPEGLRRTARWYRERGWL